MHTFCSSKYECERGRGKIKEREWEIDDVRERKFGEIERVIDRESKWERKRENISVEEESIVERNSVFETERESVR